MRRYPGNHTDSELLTVPRFLKTRPQAPTTHLAYITDDEADLLKDYKPGTPHEGAEGIPNYDTWGIDSSGTVTGGSTAGGGGAWSGDTGGNQQQPKPWSGSQDYWENRTPDNRQAAGQTPVKVEPIQKQHKFATALDKLVAAGKGNTSQANVLKSYLYGVKTEGGNNAYYEWVDKTYPSGQLDIKGQPDIYNWGEYDINAPMAFGSGSVFGANSGVPGQSNVAVTDTLKFMMQDYVKQGYEPQHAAEKAFKKFYVSNNVDYVNFMGDKTLPYSQQPAVKALMADHGGSGGGGSGGSGGGWGGYGYGGGGGGGGGGYGGELPEKPMFPGQPGERWGAQTPLQQAMIRTHGGPGFQQGFNRGGIVGLVT